MFASVSALAYRYTISHLSKPLTPHKLTLICFLCGSCKANKTNKKVYLKNWRAPTQCAPVIYISHLIYTRLTYLQKGEWLLSAWR